MKTKLVIFLLLLLSAVWVSTQFFYVDTENKCIIRVVPNILPSNWNYKEVLELLKVTAPIEYQFMCNNISTINKGDGCGGPDGGCFYDDKARTIYIGNDQDNLVLTGAIVVHELCHARQKVEKRYYDEAECYSQGWEYLNSVVKY